MICNPLESLDLDCSARDIEDYFERLEIWRLTRSKPNEENKSAFFLNAACKNAYTLIKNLAHPSPPVSVSYDDLKSLLLQHVMPTNFEASERADFHSMVRSPNQGIREFILDFGDLLDMQLKDRLIAGINKTVLQNELLKLSNSTFKDVRAYCDNIRTFAPLLHPCRPPLNLQPCLIHSGLNPRKLILQADVSHRLHNLTHTM
ncbi:unnamed protein product [Echinostoma caproni]|uniref:Retrotrans_gag domain-containing protein n=1 Tax=Echinostoma caproni TaxID=27848 RepID=A0A183ASX9_9TREM|nr:unnamed protein product [Echinostoma caproni]